MESGQMMVKKNQVRGIQGPPVPGHGMVGLIDLWDLEDAQGRNQTPPPRWVPDHSLRQPPPGLGSPPRRPLRTTGDRPERGNAR